MGNMKFGEDFLPSDWQSAEYITSTWNFSYSVSVGAPICPSNTGKLLVDSAKNPSTYALIQYLDGVYELLRGN